MCRFLGGDQPREMQRRVAMNNIEEGSQRMHQDDAQQAIAQMPQVAGPDALERAALDQLTEDRIVSIR